MPDKESLMTLAEVRFLKTITIGGLETSKPLTGDAHEKRVALLNRCLNDYPRGIIIGTDVSIRQYVAGEYRLITQSTTYHVGFSRKPMWLDDESECDGGM